MKHLSSALQNTLQALSQPMHQTSAQENGASTPTKQDMEKSNYLAHGQVLHGTGTVQTQGGEERCGTGLQPSLTTLTSIQLGAQPLPADSTAAQLNETLLALLKTLRSGLESLPKTTTPDNLVQVVSQLSALKASGAALTSFCQRALVVPENKAENAQRIFHLMAHYPKQFDADGKTGDALAILMQTRQEVMRDWKRHMSEYPAWCVADACYDWHKGPKGMYRPSIAEIRHLCDIKLAPFKQHEKEAARLLRAAETKARQDAWAESERRKNNVGKQSA